MNTETPDIGAPVSRSHTIEVSRWFVIPMAATSEASAFAFASTPRADSS